MNPSHEVFSLKVQQLGPAWQTLVPLLLSDHFIAWQVWRPHFNFENFQM